MGAVQLAQVLNSNLISE